MADLPTITIPLVLYEALMQDTMRLRRLIEAGVDNWEGFSAVDDEEGDDA